MMAEKGKHPVAMRPGGTPVPIPNTMVKTRAADDTMLGTAWESRRLPEQKKNKDNDGTGNFPCGRGLSSAGRAPALQAGGREFESLSLHCGVLCRGRTLKTEYQAKNSTKRKKERKETSRARHARRARKGQAKKGTGRMPWHWRPKKDAVSCEKPRGVANTRRSAGV